MVVLAGIGMLYSKTHVTMLENLSFWLAHFTKYMVILETNLQDDIHLNSLEPDQSFLRSE